MFVHNRALEGYLDRGVAGVTVGMGEGMVPVVPWREWGRVHARMVPNVGMFQWLRWVIVPLGVNVGGLILSWMVDMSMDSVS